MAYETGTATGAMDLIDKIEAFASDNGWTIDRYDDAGTGKRLSLHLGANYFSLRAWNAETPAANVGGGPARSGLSLVGATGFSSGADWYNQAGTAVVSSVYQAAGIYVGGALPSYHLFSVNDAIYCVIEYAAGRFGVFGFGGVDKIGTYTGGQFYFAPYTSSLAYGDANTAIFGFTGAVGGSFDIPCAFVRCDLLTFTGWRSSQTTAITGPTCGDATQLYYPLMEATPNTMNGLSTILPMSVTVNRDASNNDATPYSIIGYLPGLFLTNIKSMNVKSEQTFGTSEHYRVFSFFYKTDAAAFTNLLNTGGAGYTQSGHIGFAILAD